MHKLFLSILFLLLGNACVIGGIPIDQRILDIQGLREVSPTEVRAAVSINYQTWGSSNTTDTIYYNDPYGRYIQGFRLTFRSSYYYNRLYFRGVSSDNPFYSDLPYTAKFYDYTGTLMHISDNNHLGYNCYFPLSTRQPFMMMYIFITLPTGEVVYLRGPDIHIHFIYDNW